MQLTEPQQASVRQWAAQGAGLSEIQNRLAEEFGLRLSYMDVRLLVLELDVALREKRAAEPARTPAATGAEEAGAEEFDAAENAGGALDDAEAADAGDAAPGEVSGGVRVEISRLAQPGFAINGDVTFSDGVTAQWGITNRGELSLAAADPAYRPSGEDLQDFQRKLHRLISGGRGY